MDEIDALTQRKSELQAENIAISNSNNDLLLRAEKIEGDISTLETQKASLETEIAILEKNTELARSNSDTVIRDLQRSLDAINSSLEDAREEYQVLMGSIKGAKANLDIARSELVRVEEEIETLKADQATFVATCNTERERLNAEIRNLESQLTQYSESNDKAGKNNATLEADKIRLESIIAGKKADLAVIDNDADIASTRLSKLNAEIVDVTAKIKTQTAALIEERETAVTSLDAAISMKKEELTKLESTALRLVSKEDELSQRETMLRERYQRAGLTW